MDAHGIELMLLSLNAPAIKAAAAALPMQDPDGAARELNYCIEKLGFRGALVNGFSQVAGPEKAVYHDLKEFWPFWSEVERVSAKRHRELGGARDKSIARSRPPPKRPRSNSVTASGSYSCCPAQLCRSRVA
jgi:hypothetical protein